MVTTPRRCSPRGTLRPMEAEHICQVPDLLHGTTSIEPQPQEPEIHEEPPLALSSTKGGPGSATSRCGRLRKACRDTCAT